MANGFSYACCEEWSNLGQGAPEVGPIPDAPERPTSVEVPQDSLEYAPTTGVKGPSIYVILLPRHTLITQRLNFVHISASRRRRKLLQSYLQK